MLILRKRFTLAAGAATLVLLALPSLASARPGTGPELVQRSGRFVVVHADRDDGTATQRWMLVNGSQRLPVRAPEVWIDPGSRVQLEGTLQDGALVLSDSVTAVTELSPAPLAADATASAPALHNTAIILMGFAGGPTAASLPVDATGAKAIAFDDPASLNAYYQEQTYGQIGFTGNVFGPVNIPGAASSCGGGMNGTLYSWLGAAEAALPGFSESAYQHVVLVFPTVTTCGLSGTAGVAEIGMNHVWVNGDYSVRVLAHELGHNLGLKHAGGTYCTSSGVATPIGTTCNTAGYPYQDPFDPMGRAPTVRQMSMQHKLALHLLPPTSVKVVGASGVYHLSPMETLSGSTELLRIPKPGGGSYYVEYRSPIGIFDSQPPLLQGVLIRTEAPAFSDANAPDTSLIDMHPETPADWTDSTMDAGQLFSDPLSGVIIQDLGPDATGVLLQLNVPLDTVPPSAPGGLTAVPSGTSAVLHWTAASDDYSVDSYRVLRDGALVGAPATTDFTDAGLVPGTAVNYTVAAVDAGGNVGPAVAASVAIPDTAPPAAPQGVTARVTKDGKVHLAWGAASDNGRVAGYHVLRNGQEIASGNDLVFVDKAAKPGTGATVTYSVIAVDLVGNAGPAGNAKPLRAALLRKLAASHLKVTRIMSGARELVRVTGTVSDVKARCRLRVGGGSWHACKPKASGAFIVNMPARGLTPVTLSLKDQLGRVKLQTLRVR
jgi:chitodextrinase